MFLFILYHTFLVHLPDALTTPGTRQFWLPGGESNPGLPRDRWGYLPLFYRGAVSQSLPDLTSDAALGRCVSTHLGTRNIQNNKYKKIVSSNIPDTKIMLLQYLNNVKIAIINNTPLCAYRRVKYTFFNHTAYESTMKYHILCLWKPSRMRTLMVRLGRTRFRVNSLSITLFCNTFRFCVPKQRHKMSIL
ncbi:unnamed protein product [Aphis gossypii]|uniref:Uncharacterized protein n=1 Tax=Aphis gossypii TaxID=80765 RepID=A0A9P0NR83_APHGO|nr:unnamed protein product [Aphis gossypii]